MTYRLLASGYPIGKTFSLWAYSPLEEAVKIIDGFYVDDSGEMMGGSFQPDSGTSALEKTDFHAFDHQLGEAFTLGLISDDSTVQAYAKAFPIPIEDRQGNCHLYVELMTGDRTAFAAFGEGFFPNEELVIESRSDGEVIDSVHYADQNGNFAEYVFPEIIGKIGGVASYHVTGESCSVKVEYDWGSTRTKK